VSPIYLDHAATTPLRPEVGDAMRPLLEEEYGNSSSIHRWGRAAAGRLEEARARLAAVVGASPAEIVFTSGGTEADNLAVFGLSRLRRGAVVSSSIEHRAVLGAVQRLGEEGRPVRLLDPEMDGSVREASIRRAVEDGNAALLTLMWANNETGAVQPVEGAAMISEEARIPFHVDAVQALGKLAIDLSEVPITTAAFSAHKVGGPKGTGALFVRRGTELAPLLAGGSQENGRRSGTVNVAGAMGLAVAAELAELERAAEAARLSALRDGLESRLREAIPELVVNGADAPRLATILNVSIPGADAEALLMGLDVEGIAVSSGSACASGAVTPSHVLRAMGLPPEVAGPSLRISLGRTTTPEDVDRAGATIPVVAERARSLAGL